MSKLIQLREKLAAKTQEARSIQDEINADTSKEQAEAIEARFDSAMNQTDSIAKEIDREEKLEAAEARSMIAKRPVVQAEQEEQRSAAPEYAKVFEKHLRHGVSVLSKDEAAVLKEARAQSTGTDSAGGYTVPEGFSGQLEKSLAVWGPMFDGNIVRELNTTSGNALPWPTVDDTAGRGRLKSENASVDDDGTDDVTFGEKVLNAYVYDTGMVKVPMELLDDSAFAIEPLMADLFGERLGRTANEVLTTGTGTGQPQGIVTGSTLGKTSAAVAAITGDELIDLFHSVDPAYRASPSCRWMFNDSTLAAIRKLKDGDGNYLWSMGDVRTGEPNTFLGMPYTVNQAMDDLGTGNKPVIFGDFSRYVVRKVRAFDVLTLRERFAENFQVGMVGFKRFDGRLLNAAAVKHLANA
jgi:HK97 family phage major capsid protein